MRTKSTHKGECQVCGCIQKLPGGVLSIHGYTVKWGFFNGTCHGTGHLPFEQDKSLIEGAIVAAKERAAEIRGVQAELLEPVAPGTTKAWVQCYMTPANMRGYYSWVTVELYMKSHGAGMDNYKTFHYSPIDGACDTGEHNRRAAQREYEIKTIEEAVAYQNKEYAKSFNNTLSQIAQYIRWQQQRIQDWAPKPLKPITK